MSSAAEILVIILSIVLAIFLIIAIVLFIYLLRLTAEIRKITKTAQKTVDHIETTVSEVSRYTSPMFMADLIVRSIKKISKKS